TTERRTLAPEDRSRVRGGQIGQSGYRAQPQNTAPLLIHLDGGLPFAPPLLGKHAVDAADRGEEATFLRTEKAVRARLQRARTIRAAPAGPYGLQAAGNDLGALAQHRLRADRWRVLQNRDAALGRAQSGAAVLGAVAEGNTDEPALGAVFVNGALVAFLARARLVTAAEGERQKRGDG